MPTLWSDTLISESVAGGAGRDAKFLGLPSLGALARRIERFTVTRTIIRLDIAAAVRDSGEGDQVFDVGIGVVQDTQTVVADMPNPSLETEYPTMGWLWRSRFRIYAVAVDDQNVNLVRLDLDIRAQRKLQNGRMVLISTNNDNQGTSTAVQMSGLIRMLYITG